MGCGGNGDRIHRHNSIRDAIFTAAQSAVLAPRRESPHLIPNRQSRPADIFLLNWDRGRPAALDISVICPLQRLTIQGAAASPGHALQVGESRKRDLHHAPCASAGISFIPGRVSFIIHTIYSLLTLGRRVTGSRFVVHYNRTLGRRVTVVVLSFYLSIESDYAPRSRGACPVFTPSYKYN